MKKFLFTLGLFIISPFVAASTGTEGAAFLNIPVGAGPAAVGSAYTALATDAYAPVWNPAGLGFVQSPELAAQHLTYLESVNYEFASMVIPLKGQENSFGVSIQYLNLGSIAGTDPAGNSLGDFSSHYGAYSLAYGQRLCEKLSLGLTAKIIEAKISDISAMTFAADVGALYQVTDALNLAATLTNAGSPLKFASENDPLPLAFHVAGAYKIGNHWAVSMEGVFNQTGEMDGRVGLAWEPVSSLSLRIGYRTDTTNELSQMAGLTLGAGVKLFGQEFSYAWLPYGDLGDTQYFSLLWRFGNTQNRRNFISYEDMKPHLVKNDASTNDDYLNALAQESQ